MGASKCARVKSESILQKQEKSRIQKLTLKIKLMRLVANLISMYAIIVTRNGQEKTVVEDKLEEERVFSPNEFEKQIA
ncbi:MAG: hypothetical protein ACLVJN_09975 [Streptococcus parasanguinis]